jgi:hypothetical protein
VLTLTWEAVLGEVLFTAGLAWLLGAPGGLVLMVLVALVQREESKG